MEPARPPETGGLVAVDLWGFFVFCFFVLALFFKVKAVYIALVALGLLYFGGGRLIDRGFSRLRVERASPRTYLFPGETGEIAVRFVNDSLVPFPWLSAHDHLPALLARGKPRRWVTSIPPRGSASYSYTVTSTRRGVYSAGPIDLRAGDPLGLHQRSGRAESYHDVVVYPELLTLPELGLPSDLPVGSARARSPVSPDPARIAGIRPYSPGDVQQSIHWKATARTGELQVKQHEHTLSLDVVLILNMRGEDYAAEDGAGFDAELAVTAAAALANHLARGGESFGFVTNAALVRFKAEGEPKAQAGGVPEPETADGSGRAGPSAAASDAAGEGLGSETGEEGPAGTGAEAGAGADPGRPGGEGARSGPGAAIVRVPPRKGNRQLMRVLEILAGAELNKTGVEFHRLVADEARNYGWGATILLVTPAATAALVETGIMLRRSGYKVGIFETGSGRSAAPAPARPGLGPAVYRVRRQRDRTLSVEPERGGAAVV